MKKLNYGDSIMVLGMWVGPKDADRVDAGGTYRGEWPGQTRNSGKAKVHVNGTELAFAFDQIMPYNEYMTRRVEGTLPVNAANKPWFLEH